MPFGRIFRCEIRESRRSIFCQSINLASKCLLVLFDGFNNLDGEVGAAAVLVLIQPQLPFVGIADGDTVTVLDAQKVQHKIRLAGIDAPEKAQPFGQRSKGALSMLVFGKDVDVEWSKRDRYRRIVGKVLVTDPTCQRQCPKTLDAGLAQVSPTGT